MLFFRKNQFCRFSFCTSINGPNECTFNYRPRYRQTFHKYNISESNHNATSNNSAQFQRECEMWRASSWKFISHIICQFNIWWCTCNKTRTKITANFVWMKLLFLSLIHRKITATTIYKPSNKSFKSVRLCMQNEEKKNQPLKAQTISKLLANENVQKENNVMYILRDTNIYLMFV